MEKINLDSAPQPNALFFGNQFVLYDNLKDMGSTFLSKKEYLTECFVAAVVLEGSAQIEVDKQTHLFRKGDLFVCTPRNIIEKTMLSLDFDVRAIVMSTQYATELADLLNVGWSFRVLASNHIAIHSNEDTLQRLNAYFDLIRQNLSREDFPNKQKLINALMSAFALDFLNMQDKLSQSPQMNAYTSADNIFQHFVQLLEDRNHPYVSVSQYASELNITPKYFSSVCKKVTGKTANQIIAEEIIKTAQIMLRDRTMGIKQIADRLNFTNQSHFGTFFRHHIGCSPQQFRENLA